jgi:hypothetical protein
VWTQRSKQIQLYLKNKQHKETRVETNDENRNTVRKGDRTRKSERDCEERERCVCTSVDVASESE